MDDRSEFHAILCDILGTSNVYFQPPATIQMKYPCIVYNREPDDVKREDNIMYLHKHKYSVTVIDPNPDTLIPDRVLRLPLCAPDRFFTTSGLNHYVYTIYY